MGKAKTKVLFVCMGNICRSPAAETVMRKKVVDSGLDGGFHIDSAGTIDHHAGHPADPRMCAAADERGYEIVGKARQFTAQDFKDFDLILAMDRDNFFDIMVLDKGNEHEDKVRLLCDFVHSNSQSDVPDPYYGGEDGFQKVLDLIEEACENIISEYAGQGASP